MPPGKRGPRRSATARGKSGATESRKKVQQHSAGKSEVERPVRASADQLILNHADQILPGTAMLVLLNGTALAVPLTHARPEVSWKLFTWEHFYLTSVVNALNQDTEGTAQIELFCTPDLPEGLVDTAVVATDSKGSSELTRDLLQAVSHHLKPGGRLIVSTNNPRDHWLHQHLKDTYGRTTVLKGNKGICYVARRRESLVREKSFQCEFAFRDGERLIRVTSRPGVFSHRRVDAGARALIRSLDLLSSPAAVSSGDSESPVAVRKPKWKSFQPRKIIDMGCGCGSASAATALRYPDAVVLAVDSHARAVQSTEQTAALNDVRNVSVRLTSDGSVPDPGTWDLFICNPPYYSDFRISELFLDSAFEALRRGGRIHLVTKLTDGHFTRMEEVFGNAAVHRYGDYDVIVSMKNV